MIFFSKYSILFKTMLNNNLMFYSFYALLMLQNFARVYATKVLSIYNPAKVDDFLSNLIFNTINNKENKYQQSDLNKNIATFFQNLDITHEHSSATCSSKLIHSSSQSKMRMLKSAISTCPGYCRISMNQNGFIDGARNFNLESKKY